MVLYFEIWIYILDNAMRLSFLSSMNSLDKNGVKW